MGKNPFQASEDARTQAIADAGAADETELRDSEVPWPNTADELQSYINALVDRPHDYGTCVYAMSLAATAAFRYAAGKLGTTGFQASCADMDIIRRTRLIDGPFAIIVGSDMLYPQYDIPAKVQKLLNDWKSWAKKEAQKKLADESNTTAHPDVRKHWERLAAH